MAPWSGILTAMRVLVACEYSASVRDAFRALGHFAVSCDLLPTEGDPKWHYRGDMFDLLTPRHRWDLLIAFPPCTHLTAAGAASWPVKHTDGRQQAALGFVARITQAEVPRIAIENPVGLLSTVWRKPDQIIEPWQFGNPYTKRTCLWLKGLPLLVPQVRSKPETRRWVGGHRSGPERRYEGAAASGVSRNPRERSRTFAGIAWSMAMQWGVN